MALDVCLICLLPMAYHTGAGCPGQVKTIWHCGRCGQRLAFEKAPHPCLPSTSTNWRPFETLYR